MTGLYLILSLFVINDVNISCSKGIDLNNLIPEPIADVWSIVKAKEWGDSQEVILGLIICYYQLVRLKIRKN